MYTSKLKIKTSSVNVWSSLCWWPGLSDCLVTSSISQFAAKSCRHFSPNLTSVSVLPCENLNANHVLLPLSCLRNSRIYATLTLASKFDRFESSWLQHVGNTAREDVQNTHHWCGPSGDSIDEWMPQWQRDPAWPTPFSVAFSFRPDQLCIFCTRFLAVFSMCCSQLNLYLANLKATVNVA